MITVGELKRQLEGLDESYIVGLSVGDQGGLLYSVVAEKIDDYKIVMLSNKPDKIKSKEE